ncbi:hypothetical protein, partial [Escherichia coli]|uniref:hypothetical protein n=1 Tax=Escherichia coli TaxID=562 RepID=UPI001BDD5651
MSFRILFETLSRFSCAASPGQKIGIFFDVWRLRKSPHLGKLRVTLHFIQVTFHGYHPKKL